MLSGGCSVAVAITVLSYTHVEYCPVALQMGFKSKRLVSLQCGLRVFKGFHTCLGREARAPKRLYFQMRGHNRVQQSDEYVHIRMCCAAF